MLADLAAFLRALREATSFEDAALELLRQALAIGTEALEQEGLSGRGKMLRAMVHLRPAGGYRGLVVLERGAERAADTADARLLPSATAWRWVEQHRAPAAIDVNLETVDIGGGGPSDAAAARPGAARFASKESRIRLLGRDTTHIYALPLGARAGVIEGMLSLEAACPKAMGSAFIWPRCGADLELLAQLASPYLSALPLGATPAPETDALLPVVGAKTAGLVRLLRVFAAQEETLLLSGPTGSGKSRLARHCHDRSGRREGRFVPVDLLSVPEAIQMGELFGWRRGAFTGAAADYVGAVERAEKGTLFLDEIDKLSLPAQAGLLHLLEDRSYHPLGDAGGARKADLRFMVGTNVDLADAVRAGRFREDLYYRINVLPVRLPSLGERADEIPRWAEHMVARRAGEGRFPGEARLDAEAGRLLAAQPWPGNLRQLDNVVRRAFAIAIAERGEASPLVIGEQQVQDALAFEGPRGNEGLIAQLRRAAALFYTAAAESGGRVDLDHCEALRGLVLEAAIQRTGSREEAFRKLGKEALLKNRNHHTALRREIERVAALAEALGEALDPELLALARPPTGKDG